MDGEKPVAEVPADAALEAVAPEGSLEGIDLLHLVGVGEEAASAEAIRAAVGFARAGGTVFVESLGGGGGFAEATAAVLAAEAGEAVGPLAPGFGPLAADPERPGTVEMASAKFRPYSLQRFDAGDTPTLDAVSIDGRVAVVVSAADVSLGALGVRQWGIHGYDLETAEILAKNLLLHAQRGVHPLNHP